MTLEGTVILPNSSSRYIHAENFKLLPHSLGNTTVNLIKAHFMLPNIENILNFSEEDLLQPDVMQPVELQHLDETAERATSSSCTQSIDVNKIITTLQGKEMYRQPTDWLWIIGVVIVLMVLGILWFVWFKLTDRYFPCIWKRTPRLKPPHVITTVQELNECDIGLQTVQNQLGWCAKPHQENQLGWCAKPHQEKLQIVRC
jgi:hypothetical protein